MFTFSIHLKEPGFFPGSGDISEAGCGKGKFRCLNIPLREGITDEKYMPIFDR